jgi:acetyltransferase-like isoleucine patch superfamily enzyme
MKWRRHESEPAPRFASFGPGSVIAEPVIGIPNPEGVAIGAGVDIRAYVFLEAISPPREVGISIGDGTYLGPFVRITAFGGVTIGRNVLIADRCYISDTGHVYEDVTVPIMHQSLREGRKIHIGDGAWLGIGVAVLGGVSVGRNSVVGANSVVRDDVPDYSVVAGDPAKVIRRYVDGEWRWENPR